MGNVLDIGDLAIQGSPRVSTIPESEYLPLSVVSTVYLANRYPGIARSELFIPLSGQRTASCVSWWPAVRR